MTSLENLDSVGLRNAEKVKRESRNTLRRWKSREYKRQRQKMEDEIEQIKNMNEIWTFISRQRRRIGITNRISLQEWRKYFMKPIQGERQNIQKERSVRVLTLILA